jgi:hypothetical protein
LIRFIKRWKNWWCAVIALVVTLGFALSYTPGLFLALRSPTERETVLYYFAQNIGEPALCGQISWAAHRSYSVLFGGGGASFWRSDCYERVAEARHDPSICWLVRPWVDLDPLSSEYSAFSCRRRAKGGYISGIALPNDLLIRTFRQLGYDVDQLHLEGVIPPAIRVRDVYLGLERDAAVVARAKQLLEHRTPSLHADDRSYLAQLVAVATANPDFCAYIPADQRVNQVAAPLRDWCYYTVAFDTQDIRVCERMTPAAAETTVLAAKAAGVRPEIAEQMGLHAECARIAKRLGPRLHYGPEVPSDDQQTQRLFTALGVVMPSAHDWSPNAIAAYYQQFLFALWPGDSPDPIRDAARAKLVRRLLTLPRDS